MTGTKRCDRCWELESRIHGDPEMAAKILASIAPASAPITQEFSEFIGRLSDLAHSPDFWADKPYGNRLYYGPNAGDYIAGDILQAFLHALKKHSSAGGGAEPVAWRYRSRNSAGQWSMWTVVSQHPGPSNYEQEIVPLYTQSATRPSMEEAIVEVIRRIGVKGGIAATVYGEMCHEVRTILRATDSAPASAKGPSIPCADKIVSVTRAFDYDSKEGHAPWVMVFFKRDDWESRDAFAAALATADRTGEQHG